MNFIATGRFSDVWFQGTRKREKKNQTVKIVSLCVCVCPIYTEISAPDSNGQKKIQSRTQRQKDCTGGGGVDGIFYISNQSFILKKKFRYRNSRFFCNYLIKSQLVYLYLCDGPAFTWGGIFQPKRDPCLLLLRRRLSLLQLREKSTWRRRKSPEN